MTGSPQNPGLEELIGRRYAHGFVTDIESDTVPPGLSEDVIRFISAKKGEPDFLLDWRLKAYHYWLKQREPRWAKLHHPPIDYQAISYYSAPKAPAGPKSLDEVDPKLLATYEKLGIPLHERAKLAGVAVDAVFDSVSVTTTFKDKLAAAGCDEDAADKFRQSVAGLRTDAAQMLRAAVERDAGLTAMIMLAGTAAQAARDADGAKGVQP